jgi:hypothetical protein
MTLNGFAGVLVLGLGRGADNEMKSGGVYDTQLSSTSNKTGQIMENMRATVVQGGCLRMGKMRNYSHRGFAIIPGLARYCQGDRIMRWLPKSGTSTKLGKNRRSVGYISRTNRTKSRTKSGTKATIECFAVLRVG